MSIVNADQKLVTAAGTAEALTTFTGIVSHVTIKALKTNGGQILIVDTDDESKSFPLEPGEGITLNINNASLIRIDADVSGEGVDWIAT